MKAFSTEVWILPASTKPLWPGGCSYWDIHQEKKSFYDVHRHSVRPLYIAFRANAVVQAIYRVRHIEHETPPIKYVPELKKLGKEWPSKPMTIWHLDDPVPLPYPIPTGGSLWQRDVRCDMDILLPSTSVKEIEDKMRARREEGQ